MNNIDRARALIDKANECRTEGAIGFLVLALEAICDELQDHQHSYRGPAGIAGQWCNTGPRRDTDSAAHAAYLKAQAEKKRPATAGEKEES